MEVGIMHDWKIEYTHVYSEEADMTFLMELHYDCGFLKTMTCVGWYYGEPNEICDEKYRHQLTAYFNEEVKEYV